MSLLLKSRSPHGKFCKERKMANIMQYGSDAAYTNEDQTAVETASTQAKPALPRVQDRRYGFNRRLHLRKLYLAVQIADRNFDIH